MKVRLLILLVCLVGVACAQSVPPSSASAAGDGQQQLASSALAGLSATQNVFHAGSGVIAPELIVPQIPIERVHHCEKLDGKPIIALVVDANGNPASPLVTQPADGKLNEAALTLVVRDRFRPGTHDGVPAAIAVEIEVTLKTCARYAPQGNGVFILASLREEPVQKLTVSPPVSPEIAKALSETPNAAALAGRRQLDQQSGPVVAPVPLNAPTAHYTDAAKRAKIMGDCLVRIVVDAYGNPKNPVVVKGLDPGLDQEAIKSVMQYRFKPAMRNGQPVPVQITIAINFKLH
jgi:TonB family protein